MESNFVEPFGWWAMLPQAFGDCFPVHPTMETQAPITSACGICKVSVQDGWPVLDGWGVPENRNWILNWFHRWSDATELLWSYKAEPISGQHSMKTWELSTTWMQETTRACDCSPNSAKRTSHLFFLLFVVTLCIAFWEFDHWEEMLCLHYTTSHVLLKHYCFVSAKPIIDI